MRIRIGTIVVIIYQLLFIPPVCAGFKEVNTTRPAGMGGAFIGLADDADALLYNPAGVSQLENPEISFMYAKPSVPEDQPHSKWNYLSFIHPLGNNLGNLGLGWTGVSVLGSHRENTFLLNYGMDWETFIPGLKKDTLYTGLNLKSLVYSEEIKGKDDFDLLFDTRHSTSAVTADFGILYKPSKKFSLGAVVKNFTQPSIDLNNREKILLRWGLGASYTIQENKTLVLDLTRKGDDWDTNFGGEIWFFNKRIGLRHGINSDMSATGITIGRILTKSLDSKIDYTFQYPFNREKNYKIHWLSIGIKISPLKSEEIISEKEEIISENGEKQAEKKIVTYHLGPEDELEIIVRNHPEFSGKVVVDPYGSILIPLLGEMKVEGMTRDELAGKIEKDVQSYIEKPYVSVVITQYRSKTVYILGEVARPGKYFIKGDKIDLREAILQAGLPSGLAATWRVYVIKSRAEKPPYRVINLYRILYRGEMKSNVNLEPDDIVYVPLTILGKISSSLGHLLDPFYKTKGLTDPMGTGLLLPEGN